MMIEELAPDYFLLRTGEPDFNRNIYLRKYNGENREINVLMDPGSRADLDPLLTNLKKLIGDAKKVGLIFLSHQDPDLTSSVYALMEHSSGRIITSEDTWRLLRMIGLDKDRFVAVESFPAGRAKLATGHFIQFIPAYFCHFRGAQMLYDEGSRVLFTGDFLSGLLTKKHESIYAIEQSWPGIKTFHEIYMPSNAIVKATVERIKAITPKPIIVAPQHGDIIEGVLIDEFLDRLYGLPVGTDIIGNKDLPDEISARIMNKALRVLKRADAKKYEEFISVLRDGGNFTPLFTIDNDGVSQVKVKYNEAVDAFMEVVNRSLPEEIGKVIRMSMVTGLQELGIEIPQSLVRDNEVVIPLDDLIG